MKNMTKEREVDEHPDIVHKVHQAQIEILYRQTWTGLGGVFVLTICVCAVLWQIVPPWKLVLWAGVLSLITAARALLSLLFQGKTKQKTEITKWAKWHVIGVCASGLLWAVPSFFLWPENSPEHNLIWALCILPLSSSAIATYYTWKASYTSFLFLSALPVALRFFYEGGYLYLILGFLTLFFIAVLIQAGNLINKVSLHTLNVGFRNEALSAELQKAHDQLKEVSLTDELTGLRNRRYINTTMKEDIAQVLRSYRNFNKGFKKIDPDNSDIVFILVDLDHFKEVNDTFGHGAGDMVLQQMGIVLKKSFRDMDTTVRWGGEEFLVVSRNSRRDTYTVLLERIRKGVASHKFDIGQGSPLRLTCSMGASTFPFLMDCPEVLPWSKVVDVADACLYAAKRSGRNAWVGVLPTALATSEDISQNLTSQIPSLLDAGKLEMKTSLKKDTDICWTDDD